MLSLHTKYTEPAHTYCVCVCCSIRLRAMFTVFDVLDIMGCQRTPPYHTLHTTTYMTKYFTNTFLRLINWRAVKYNAQCSCVRSVRDKYLPLDFAAWNTKTLLNHLVEKVQCSLEEVAMPQITQWRKWNEWTSSRRERTSNRHQIKTRNQKRWTVMHVVLPRSVQNEGRHISCIYLLFLFSFTFHIYLFTWSFFRFISLRITEHKHLDQFV